jgi:hypothetical protein
MPFDPNSPFDPTDPAQWWRLQNLPHILVQPNAPPTPAPGNAEDDGLPNDWFVPEADGFPNDWINPGNNNAPAPSPTPSAAPSAPSPPPNPVAANRSLEHLDPYHAFWSQMPASRAGAFAWHPPIFLSPDPSTWLPPTLRNAFGQLPLVANAVAPDFGLGGIPGGFGRAIAEQARANNPWAALANDVLGGNPKMAAAPASTDPMSLAAFGSLANPQPGAANAPAAASSVPMSRRFLPPDPLGFQGASNLYSYAGNDPLNRGDTTGFAASQSAIQTTPPNSPPFADASGFRPSNPEGASDTPDAVESQYYRHGQTEGFPTQPGPNVNWPPIRLVNESTEEEKLGEPFPDHDHLKSDPSWVLNPFGESSSIAGRIGWGAGTPGPGLVPYRAGPPPAPPISPPPAQPSVLATSPPPMSAPPPPRASLPSPPVPPPGALSLPSSGQATVRPPGTAIGPAPAQQSAPTTRDGLLRHLADARARVKLVGLTDAQRASLRYRPWLEPMHRGE